MEVQQRASEKRINKKKNAEKWNIASIFYTQSRIPFGKYIQNTQQTSSRNWEKWCLFPLISERM